MGLLESVKSYEPWVRRPEVLLCANTVKPMHGVTPRTILGQEWWDRTRRAAYRSTDHHCVACGVHATQAKGRHGLEGHEVYKVDYRLGRMEYVETVPLCHWCHCFIHSGRLMILYEKGEITRELVDAIMAHGTAVLTEAKLKKRPAYSGPIADWEKWRLILDGVEHPPKYKDYQEWLAFDQEDEE